MSDRSKVFIMVTGPYRNIGDSLIRRRALAWARAYGPVVVLMSGEPSKDWDASLGIQSQDELVRSRLGWLRKVCGAPTRSTLVIEPGEFNTDLRFLLSLVYIALAALALKMKGGRVVQFPRSQAKRSILGDLLYRFSIAAGLVFWRESLSEQRFGCGWVIPDIGFDSSREFESSSRDLLVVSLRGDRPQPSEDWSLAVKQFASEADLRIVALTQVEADNARSTELGALLEGDVDLWDSGVSSIDRERDVRNIYSRTALVLSDRLHALVIGAVMGAIPLEIVQEPNGKVRRHFSVLGLDMVSHDSSALTRGETVDVLRESFTKEAVVIARVRDAATALSEARLQSERFVGVAGSR